MHDEPQVGDAFGAALMACFEARSAAGSEREAMERGSWYVVERDDGFIDIGNPSHYFASDRSQWNAAEQWAIERARGRTVDVGCGAGRHSLALQAEGFDITGIDV